MAKTVKRGLLAVERKEERKLERAIHYPLIRSVATGKSWRWYWPEGYEPKIRTDVGLSLARSTYREYIPQPLTSGKMLELPRYLETLGRSGKEGRLYSLITRKRRIRAFNWVSAVGFRVKEEK